jgi:ABC-type amino acid transport substrate-binding protein
MIRLTSALLLLSVASPAYAADPQAAHHTAYDRVVTSDTLRCGYGISPPNLVKDPNTGAVSGLDVDLWNAIGRELGVKIEWAEEAGWGNFIEGLKTGRYDAFCSMYWPDPARSKYITPTIPVLYSSLQTYVRTDDTRFNGNLEAINDASVKLPVIEGDVSVGMAQNRFPRATLYTLPQTATLSDMFMALIAKKADVMFLNDAMFAALDKSHPGALRKLEKTPDPFIFASYYGVAPGEFQLRDTINMALRTLIDTGELEKIARQHDPSSKPPLKNY